MAMQRFTNPGLPAVLAGTLLALYACSFQDFPHLQGGTGGSAAGSGKGGTGNGGTAGSLTGSGGDAATGGSTAGTESAGGASGEAGWAGEAGIGGTQPEGGAPSGGTSSGGKAGGGTGGSLASGGEAGEASETGGSGGLGGSGGQGGSSGSAGSGGLGGFGGSPPLVGNLLQNPGFQSGLAGWTIDPPTATSNRHVYTQTPNPPNGTSGSLATWHETQEYSVYVSQTITGLVPGTYTFKGLASTQRTQQAYFFARNYGGEELQLPIPLVSFEWQEYTISIPVTGTSCEVGLFVHNVAVDWVNADEFSFEKDP